MKTLTKKILIKGIDHCNSMEYNLCTTCPLWTSAIKNGLVGECLIVLLDMNVPHEAPSNIEGIMRAWNLYEFGLLKVINRNRKLIELWKEGE